MKEILIKLINNEKINREDIYDALYEICDDVHSGCDSECPIYAIMQQLPGFQEIDDCGCFKNGKKMYDFIKKNG